MRSFRFLRVGICSCSPTTTAAWKTCRSSSNSPLATDVRVPTASGCTRFQYPTAGSGQRETLRQFRCHFFLDFHRVGLRGEVKIIRNVFLNGPGTICRLLIGGGGIQEWRRRMRHEWNMARPPQVDTVVKAAGELLTELDGPELQRWLEATTPPHWRMPRPRPAPSG